MTSWGDKTKRGLDDWFTKPPAPEQLTWSDRIAGWVINSLAKSGTKMLEDFEPAAIDSVKDILTKAKDDPNTPPELKATIEKTLTPGNPIVYVRLIGRSYVHRYIGRPLCSPQ